MGNKLRFINNADDKYTNCAPKNLLCNTVFRIALYATTNIKAGTELFFTYNYPKELTASFKQPNGKLVAVKQVKPKIKNKSSLHRSGSPTHDPSPAVLAAAAKARAAKAAKRAAMLAEQAAQTSASKITPHQRARKTVTHQFQHSEAPGLRAVKSVRTSANRAERIIADSGTDVEASDHALPLMSKPRRSQAARYVRDSEDDYTVEESPQLDDDDAVSEIEETAQEESDEPARRRRSGRPRKIPVAVPPVVAVKKKMGGARPGAGRKRKR
jgi:histone-lysine N-methyltransferase EZH2